MNFGDGGKRNIWKIFNLKCYTYKYIERYIFFLGRPKAEVAGRYISWHAIYPSINLVFSLRECSLVLYIIDAINTSKNARADVCTFARVWIFCDLSSIITQYVWHWYARHIKHPWFFRSDMTPLSLATGWQIETEINVYTQNTELFSEACRSKWRSWKCKTRSISGRKIVNRDLWRGGEGGDREERNQFDII